MKITRLTSGGRVNNAVITGGTSISPDGKFVVFALFAADPSSLWMRQVLTGSNVQIVAPPEGRIGATTISRDSEFVYYTWFEKDNPQPVLFQVPVFGGTPRKVLAGVDSPITFSPDGRRFAFVRSPEGQIESSLMVATPMAVVSARWSPATATTCFLVLALPGPLEKLSRAPPELSRAVCLRLWLRCWSKGDRKNRSPRKNG